jgi:hypothetical protein
VSSWRGKLALWVAKEVAGAILTGAAAQIGEAIGKRIGSKIYTPPPEPPPPKPE